LMAVSLTEQDWQIRHRIFHFFVTNARPPTIDDIAGEMNLVPEEVRMSFRRLHEAHTIFLEPGTDRLRMAAPLSAVPTRFQVEIGARRYWANCAWDSLGIPAMLKQDARIEAKVPPMDETVRYAIHNGQLEAPEFLVHIALPVRRWYDSLIDT